LEIWELENSQLKKFGNGKIPGKIFSTQKLKNISRITPKIKEWLKH